MAAATALAAGGLVSIPSGHHTTTAPPESATAVISGENSTLLPSAAGELFIPIVHCLVCSHTGNLASPWVGFCLVRTDVQPELRL